MYIIFTKKKILIFSVSVLIFGIILSGSIGMIRGKDVFGAKDGERLLVVIDAGHGGVDGGAVGVSGCKESDLNLDVAMKLKEILNAKGIDTVLTRKDEKGIYSGEKWDKITDMKMRKDIVASSNADLFISIHMNHFTMEKVKGLRVFYSANHKEIEDFAEIVQNSVSKVTGAKTTNIKAADKGLFLMKSPPMPAVLIECGFLSNREEEDKLKSDEYRAKIAWAIADSIESYFSS